MTLKITLLNMPFASLAFPSLALAQLKAVVDSSFPGKVSTNVIYLNHEFGALLGPGVYDLIAEGFASQSTGFGEWLFRQAAFPQLPDNTSEYMLRFSTHFSREFRQLFARDGMRLRNSLVTVLDRLIEKYSLSEADIVGMTSMFQQNLPCIALARRLKQVRPDQTIVMGGANCEGTMGLELVNNVEVIDFVFSAHSLISFPQFVQHRLSGSDEQCHGIDGVFSRKNSQSIDAVVGADTKWDCSTWRPVSQLKGIRAVAPELDVNATINFDYEDFFESLGRLFPADSLGRAPGIMFETSRGCWWGERAHCTFCGLNGESMSYRAMHPERALALIERLISRYGSRAGVLECVDNILPREYFEGLFPRLRPPENLTLFYEIKADLTQEQVKALARARVLDVQPGIESFATSTLKLMRKGTTAFQNVQCLSHCLMYGVRPRWNLLVGFPGEGAATYESYLKILPDMFHLQPPSGVHPVRFDRYSPYFTNAAHYGLSLTPQESYGFVYPFSARSLMNMAYYFRDTNLDAAYAREVAEWLAPMTAVVSRWRSSWSSGVESRPQITFRETPGGHIVDDTRAGYRVMHEITASERGLLLRSLERPVRVDDLPEEARGSLERLRELRVIFEERGRMMSLAS